MSAMSLRNNQTIVIEEGENIPMEMDLCELLSTMKLDPSVQWSEKSVIRALPPPVEVQDILMFEDPNYHSDGGSEYSTSSLGTSGDEVYGCAYLQTIRSRLDNYATTNGEYLEAIFTHREMLSAYPAAHYQCARGFTDIASVLEKRAWRADRDADMEAVVAFRHEAWMVAASISSPLPVEKPVEQVSNARRSYHVCVMPPM